MITIIKKRILRIFADGKTFDTEDEMGTEKRITLFIDGKKEVLAVLTPENEILWALGNLYCRKMIKSAADVSKISVTEEGVFVERKTLTAGIPAETRFLHTASAAFLPQAKPQSIKNMLPIEWQISAASIMEGIAWIAEAPLFKATGAMHVAALISPSGEKLFRTEDIGRHNAVDKAIGWLVQNSLEPKETALITSGRLPEDMVQKGLNAGIPLMASVSAATAQGAESAEAGGMTLIGFAREKRMNIYCHKERITL